MYSLDSDEIPTYTGINAFHKDLITYATYSTLNSEFYLMGLITEVAGVSFTNNLGFISAFSKGTTYNSLSENTSFGSLSTEAPSYKGAKIEFINGEGDSDQYSTTTLDDVVDSTETFIKNGWVEDVCPENES